METDIKEPVTLDKSPWPAKDVCKSDSYAHNYGLIFLQIIYVSILGPLMVAAFFEWILWLVAFLYCLVKVFQKADHWSVRVLAAIMMVLFSALR